MRRALILTIVLAGAACGFPEYTFRSGPVTDGGANGSDADSSPFCAAHAATFCADFDESSDVTLGWDRTDSRGDESLGEFTAAPHSAPRSLLARTGRNAGVQNPNVVVVHEAHATAKIAAVDLELRLETADGTTTGGAGVVAVLFGVRGGVVSIDPSLELIVGSQDDTSEDYLPPSTKLALRLHEWTHVHFVVEAGTTATAAGTVTLVATRAGEPPVTVYDRASLQTARLTGALATTSPPVLSIGSYFARGDGAGWAFAFDDVVFEAQ